MVNRLELGMVVLEEKYLNRLIENIEDGAYDYVYFENGRTHWYWQDLSDDLAQLLIIGKQNTKSILENGEVK